MGWLLATHHENLTIGLSIFAVGTSLFSLGWNVYRDVILKPRFRVRLRIAERPSDITRQRPPEPWWSRNPNGAWVPYLELSVVNLGPGLVVVGAAVIKVGGTVERVLAEHLGTRLEKGERIGIMLPNSDECVLDKKLRRIGIRDTFGRVRWAPRKDLDQVRREYVEGKAKIDRLPEFKNPLS
jgi:hypothetical protein